MRFVDGWGDRSLHRQYDGQMSESELLASHLQMLDLVGKAEIDVCLVDFRSARFAPEIDVVTMRVLAVLEQPLRKALTKPLIAVVSDTAHETDLLEAYAAQGQGRDYVKVCRSLGAAKIWLSKRLPMFKGGID